MKDRGIAVRFLVAASGIYPYQRTHPDSCCSGNGGSVVEVQWSEREADHSPLCIAEVNMYAVIHVFLACAGTSWPLLQCSLGTTKVPILSQINPEHTTILVLQVPF
jgi:hypothetical protein